MIYFLIVAVIFLVISVRLFTGDGERYRIL